MAGAKSKPVVAATEGETKQVNPKGSKTERAGAATASPSKLDAKKKNQE